MELKKSNQHMKYFKIYYNLIKGASFYNQQSIQIILQSIQRYIMHHLLLIYYYISYLMIQRFTSLTLLFIIVFSQQNNLNVPHQGGLSSVSNYTICSYLNTLTQVASSYEWKQSIKNLQKIINSDPVLRYNWQNGISLTDNLQGKDGKAVLSLINAALYTPPAYDTCDLVGFPINAVLIEFMQNQNGRTFFSSQKINSAFKDILNDYGNMVESSQSLLYMNDHDVKGWFSPSIQMNVNYSQFQQYKPNQPHYGFKSWNQWFLRHFVEGARPIGANTPHGLQCDNVIVNSCQSTPISLPYQPVTGVNATDAFWLKDDKYSLVDMFGNYGFQKGYSDLFTGGTVYQAFLSALLYHHWHAPIDGQIIDIYTLPGTYFLDQSQIIGYFDPGSPNDSQSFISATAARMVMLIKAKNIKLGYVALIFVGMAEVSSCVASKSIGDHVKKGDHIGNFAYGGSSHVIVFQDHVDLSFSDKLYENINMVKKGKVQRLSSYLAHING